MGVDGVAAKSDKFVVGCWFLVVGRWRKRHSFVFGRDFFFISKVRGTQRWDGRGSGAWFGFQNRVHGSRNNSWMAKAQVADQDGEVDRLGW